MSVVVLSYDLEDFGGTVSASPVEASVARTEQVRNDVNELLEEIRDPAEDTRRSELWRTAERIERLVEDLHVLIEETHP